MDNLYNGEQRLVMNELTNVQKLLFFKVPDLSGVELWSDFDFVEDADSVPKAAFLDENTVSVGEQGTSGQIGNTAADVTKLIAANKAAALRRKEQLKQQRENEETKFFLKKRINERQMKILQKENEVILIQKVLIELKKEQQIDEGLLKIVLQ